MMGAFDFLAAIAGQAMYFVFLAGAALGALVGLMLMLDSRRMLGWNERMSRWVSTREALRPLDEPHDIKRFVYRSHRVIGVLVIAGALYALDVLTFGFQTETLARVFHDLGAHGMLAMVLDALRLFLILGNLAALGAGTVLAFRPSLLKGIESWADRYYATTRDSANRLDELRFQPDRWVAAHPRLAGVLVLAASAYVLIRLGVFVIN